jgi:heme o synthase
MRNFRDTLNIFAELGKMRITFFVAISGSVGYIMAGGSIDLTLLFTALGIFILSVGSSAFNHLQEITTDGMMRRTMNRPLPKNIISSDWALLFAIISSVVGLILLLLSSGANAFLLGILALIWYNLIYTPLKKKTAWAIMPGAVVGAIPPAIGWVAAGGDIMAPQLWALALFFFIWQIPHFWFLLLLYDNDYRRAGFPTLTSIFNEIQLKRISYTWVAALVATCMLIPMFDVHIRPLSAAVLLLAGIILVWRTRNLIAQSDIIVNPRLAFIDINIYVLAVVFILSADKLI